MKKHLRVFVRRWHQRLGLFSALILVVIAVTGVLLNHTVALKLGESYVQTPLLLQWYGIRPAAVTSYRAGLDWVSQTDDGRLYLNQRPVTHCSQPLVGASRMQGGERNDLILVACDQELRLLDTEGHLLESIGQDYGLPVPLAAVGSCGDRVCIRYEDQAFVVDLERLSWAPFAGEVSWSGAEVPKGDVLQEIQSSYLGQTLSWQKVVQDVHSGRVFGRLGVVVFDVAAVAMLLLALSGFWLWWRGHR